MSYALLGRLREASFRGVNFLVKDSAIQFGQKTVVHQFPNSKKTEVEYLGIAEDAFQLEIYVHGAGLLEKRKRLKEALAKGEDGTLIHPYEGEINCAVIGPVTVVDNDRNLGVSRFSVTFQQSTPQAFPQVSTNNKPGILKAIDALLGVVEDTFDVITTTFSPNAIAQATKLTDVADTMDNAVRLTYKVADKANEFNQQIADFRRKINSYAQAPGDLKRAFTSLFKTMNFIAEDSTEQLRILRSMFDFGDDDRTINETTLEREERAKNNKVINDGMKANTLGLAYGTASDIDFANTTELNEVRQTVEDQYEAIKENLDNDILESLESVRNLTINYLDNLDLSDVITYDTQSTSLVLLTHSLYGTIDKYDEINELNDFSDPAFISGEVKVLNE